MISNKMAMCGNPVWKTSFEPCSAANICVLPAPHSLAGHPSHSISWCWQRSTECDALTRLTLFNAEAKELKIAYLIGIWSLGISLFNSPYFQLGNMGLSENMVYSQWNSQPFKNGIMISKTIGYNGVHDIFRHTHMEEIDLKDHVPQPFFLDSAMFHVQRTSIILANLEEPMNYVSPSVAERYFAAAVPVMIRYNYQSNTGDISTVGSDSGCISYCTSQRGAPYQFFARKTTPGLQPLWSPACSRLNEKSSKMYAPDSRFIWGLIMIHVRWFWCLYVFI